MRAVFARGGACSLVALCAVLTISSVAPTSASARGLVTGLDDPLDFTSPRAAVRSEWFGRAQAANAGIVRIDISWRDVVGSKPANPANPADPSYHLGAIDGAVQSASANGLAVLLGVE